MYANNVDAYPDLHMQVAGSLHLGPACKLLLQIVRSQAGWRLLGWAWKADAAIT